MKLDERNKQKFKIKNWIPFIKLSSVWLLLGLKKNQNGGCCHGNQGTKNVKFPPNFTNFCRHHPSGD
jgi:hypothetical protein